MERRRWFRGLSLLLAVGMAALLVFQVLAAGDRETIAAFPSGQTEDVTVPLGTPIGEVGLPEILMAYLADGTPAEVPVTWVGDYDGDEPGDYVLTAQLDSAFSYAQAAPTLKVTVVEDGALTLNNITGTNDTAINTFIRTDAPTNTGDAWRNRLNTVMQERLAAFQWTETTLTKWNGTTATSAPKSGNVWTVTTGAQLRYALQQVSNGNGNTIRLGADLDMAGYRYNWEKIVMNRSFTLDGQGHTIYNLGIYDNEFDEEFAANYPEDEFGEAQLGGGAFIQQGNFRTGFTVQNLTFASVKMAVKGMSALFQGAAPDRSNYNCVGYATVKSVYVEDSLFYTGVPTTMYGYGSAALLGSAINCTIEQCAVENTTVYGGSHTAALTGVAQNTTVKNSYSVGSYIISGTYHSGGFISCANNGLYCENCFTNNTVYGETMTGVFIGCVQNYDCTFKNCYASGSIEGLSQLGGFVGVSQSMRDNAPHIYENCYSTSIVGMQYGGSKQGGFVGEVRNATSSLQPYYGTRINGNRFLNCYAAGEVGSLDTVVDNSHVASGFDTVGGFVGAYNPSQTSGVTFDHCYYDKQTTAMREWASGWQKELTGVTGVLTTKTDKSGLGLTNDPTGNASGAGFRGFTNGNSGWVFNDDYPHSHYPQLAVFFQAGDNPGQWGGQERADLVWAYAKASTATVFLETWETDLDGKALPATVYDTVRDITQSFEMTTETANHNATWTTDETAGSLFGQAGRPLITIHGGQGTQTYYASVVTPGIEWLTVRCSALTSSGGVTAQYGTRRLRVVPTNHLNSGGPADVMAGTDFYDHADDVQLAYSTGPRMAANAGDITTGVFPDVATANSPWSAAQAAAESNQKEPYLSQGNDKFAQIDLSAVAAGSKLVRVDIAPVVGIGDGNVVQLGDKLVMSENNWANKWNGYTPFDTDDIGRYAVTYYWALSDGRYLSGTKLVTVTAEHTVTINVVDQNGNPLPDYLRIGVYTAETIGGSASVYSYEATETVSGVGHQAEQASVGWRVKDGQSWTNLIDVTSLKVEMFEPGANGTSIPIGSATVANPDGGSRVTIPVEYVKYVADTGGRLIALPYTVSKSYSVNSATYVSGSNNYPGWYLPFDAKGTFTVTHPETGEQLSYNWRDVEHDIVVTLTVNVERLTLNLRQVVEDDLVMGGLPVPDTGTATITSVAGSSQTGGPSWTVDNIKSGVLSQTSQYTQVQVDRITGQNGFLLAPTVPDNYTLAQITGGSSQTGQTALTNNILPISGDSDEYWATIYLRPTGRDLTFIKVDENGDAFGAGEATFQLYSCGNTDPGHVHDELASADSQAAGCWQVTGETVITAQTDADGRVTFPALPDGEYMLVETATKDGYQLPLGQWLITVDAVEGEISITGKGEQPVAFKTETVLMLPNYPVWEMPAAGGTGTLLFTIGGVVLVGAAAILLIVTRKGKDRNGRR